MDITIDLFPMQEDFFLCCTDPKLPKHPLYTGGFGAGKTHVFTRAAIALALINNPPGMLTEPTYAQLERTLIPSLKAASYEMGISHSVKRSNPPVFYIHADRKRPIYLASGDNPDSLVGPNLAWAGVDEIARCDEELWGVMTSRVRHPDAAVRKAFGAGTPEGFNWVHKKWVKERNDMYALFTAATANNTYLDHDYIESIMSAYDEEDWPAYLRGEFTVSTKGRAYKKFSRTAHVKDASPFTENGDRYHPSLPTVLCVDFNTEFCVWTLAQFKDKYVYVFDEIAQHDTDTYQMAKETQERMKKYGVKKITVFGDATGRARSSAGKTDYAILSEYGITSRDVPLANPLVKDRVNTVNMLFRENRTTVHPDCEYLINDLEQVTWKEGATGSLDKSNILLTHASDGFGYFAYRRYALTRKPPPPQRTATMGR